MNFKKLSTIICILFPLALFSQDQKDREYIKKQTNVKALEALKLKFEKSQKENRLKANKEIKMTVVNENGITGYLYAFDKDGIPIYAYDDNVNAAKTGRTDRIWVGGSMGLNLTGAGIQIGVWESGSALPGHQEFGGRASRGDGANPTSHGTHTGGTLIAAGIDPNARGMASEATIVNYTASGMPSESASFAANGGILANNSNSPGGTMGVYDANARGMDEVTYNAPYYLHVKSAGNSGNTYGRLKTNQLAKNLLVVGNTVDVLNYTGPASVTMNTSSSFGPPNDWRIKPDISNNGTSVYSSNSSSNTSYSTKTGTSMSTPATTGTIALLQQYYKNINNVYMRAATAKALIINTADEVGAHDGPDFGSGWGLVNAEKAATAILNNGNSSFIEEKTLSNGGSYSKSVNSDGLNPTSITIAWNDPAGLESASNSPRLVNDLDLRIINDANGTTYLPWVMVPNSSFNNYSDPAQKGDNFRDNVERIDAVLPAGSYTISVNHKGTLSNGQQDFSIVATGLTTGPPVQYTITTNVTGSGSILLNPVSTGNVYNSGTTVTVTAAPETGHAFSLWSGDLTGGQNPTTILINGNKNITAAFVDASISPVAVANGPYNANVGEQITFSSSGSNDPDGSIVSYLWNFGDGSTSSDANPNHSYLSANTYSVLLTVTDNHGNSNTASTTAVIADLPDNFVKIPYSTGFENGSLDANWEIFSSGANGRIQVNTSDQPYDGSYHLTMDVSVSGTYVTNEAWIKLDLEGETEVAMSFYWKEFNDEVHEQDGVFLSSDGGQTFTKVYDLVDGNAIYREIILDIDDLAFTNGVSLTNKFVIKLQQHDNFPFTNDGFAFDNISITKSGTTPPVAVINGPYTAILDTAISFSSAGSSDLDGSIVSYLWDFGDGNISTEANPNHSYSSAGLFNISLTVTDNDGLTDEKTSTANILDPFDRFAKLPYFNGFEEGSSRYIGVRSSTEFGRIHRTTAYSPHSGSTHLTMDVTTNGNYNTNELFVRLDLEGHTNVAFNFYYKEFSDESDDLDGVYLSDNDGINFVKVYDLVGAPNRTYQQIALDIDQLATENNLTLSSEFVVKIQQYDNYSITSDGFAIDDISVTSTDPSALAFNMNPNNLIYDESSEFNEEDDLSVEIIPGSDNRIPTEYSLLQNFPNPFNPTTKINYNIKKSGKVNLTVYDLLGRKVVVLVNKFQDAASYSVKFNSKNLSSGMYFYVLKTDEFTATRKMILLK